MITIVVILDLIHVTVITAITLVIGTDAKDIIVCVVAAGGGQVLTGQGEAGGQRCTCPE
jgi:hypothetical protein